PRQSQSLHGNDVRPQRQFVRPGGDFNLDCVGPFIQGARDAYEELDYQGGKAGNRVVAHAGRGENAHRRHRWPTRTLRWVRPAIVAKSSSAGQWPWAERPRWSPEEIEAAERNGAALPPRTPTAVKKYISRHRGR